MPSLGSFACRMVGRAASERRIGDATLFCGGLRASRPTGLGFGTNGRTGLRHPTVQIFNIGVIRFIRAILRLWEFFREKLPDSPKTPNTLSVTIWDMPGVYQTVVGGEFFYTQTESPQGLYGDFFL